jgi:hypothetical protein
MEIPGARWIIAGFGLLTCVLIAVYVVKGFRDMALGHDQDSTSYLEEFQRLRDEGKLNKDEYDRLKKNLPQHLAGSLNAKQPVVSNDDPGDPEFVELNENE